MDEVKGILKKVKSVIIIPILIIVVILMILIGSMYTIFDDDFKDLAETQKEYRESIKVTPEGLSRKGINGINLRNNSIPVLAYVDKQTSYNRVANVGANSIQKISDLNYNLDKHIIYTQQSIGSIGNIVVAAVDDNDNAKTKAEQYASELDFLDKYIEDSPTQTKEEKLAYLMNAEVVNRFPYIQSIDGDSTKLNGTIKFQRYLSTIEDGVSGTNSESIRLTFIEQNAFKQKLNAFKISGNMDIFNYFTIDEEQNVIIAYGSKTERVITTTDSEVTKDVINEVSAETYSKKEEGIYESKTYTIGTKAIDYQSLVEQYVLPFNFLAALLVQTRDYNLVKEIADIAYQSEIVIGIYDNETVTEKTDEYKYNKKIKYTENTKLIFDNIRTQPAVTISSSRYSSVIKECFGKLDETRENAIHISGIDLKDLDTATGNRTDGKIHETYISKISADGIVGEISNNLHEFKTTFKVKTVTNSAPTVDMVVADIWAGKWVAEYIADENNSPDNKSTFNLADEEFLNIDSNKLKQNLLSTNSDIGKKLTNHSEQLRKEAIEKIIEKTDFTVSPRTKTVEDIRIHGNSCEECKQTLDSNYGTNWATEPTDETKDTENEKLLNAVEKQENLKTVKEHIEETLKIEAEGATKNKKEKFIKDINSAGQVTYNQWATLYKANVSITGTNTYKKDTSEYKKISAKMEGQGEKLAEILNKTKYAKARVAILTRTEWIFNLLREYEDTAKLENVIRYIFNMAFNTKQFGQFAAEDVENIFAILKLGEEMIPVSTSGFNDLKEYIRSFENSSMLAYINGKSSYNSYVSKYITEDKKYYIMQTDGYGHNTIGFGVDIFNGGFEDDFALAGYSTDIGTQVPVEFVDALEEEELRSKLSAVKKKTKDLNLEIYQIYALVSRAYNCGTSGALDDLYTEFTFKEAYTRYFNQDEDNKYGNVVGDFNHELYTNYMSIPIKSNGEIAPGLVTRRESEWTLFQTGYMDTLKRWCGVASYPEEIRTFIVGDYIFPEYPQEARVGDTNLYAKERFGYPEANKTLGSSGCGIFSMSMILSGLLGDASIDPITFRDAMEQDSRIGYSYHAWDPTTKKSEGSYVGKITHKEFLYETYGVSVERDPSYNEVIQALKEGKAVLASEPGHFVVVVAVPDELQGQGYEFFVIDSARGHTGAYTSIQDFKSKTRQDYLKFRAIISQ